MLPVSIITGFLGSGKTTLLNQLLRTAELKSSLVIINEFGEVGIDHLLVSAPAENIRLLANGCLCCEVRGDLVDTLLDVSRKRSTGEIPAFDRILIETTGLADPVPIIKSIVTDKELGQYYQLDVVIGVVDAIHASEQLSKHREARKQAVVSDVILLSKVDLVDAARVNELAATMKALNAGADVVPISNGRIDPERLFGKDVRKMGLQQIEHWLSADRSDYAGFDRGEHWRHSHDIATFTLHYTDPVSSAGLATWLSMLASFKGSKLLRVKGIVNVSGMPHVIHAVQSVIHEPVALEAWPTSDTSTRIVFIVQGLDQKLIERSFSAFTLGDSLGSASRFDPLEYSAFQVVANHLI